MGKLAQCWPLGDFSYRTCPHRITRIVKKLRNLKNCLTRITGRLLELQTEFDVIGDVRGRGLFFAIDLVTDHETKAPATEAAAKIVNDMRANGVLISKIGVHDNVLKIRPPLCFSKDDANVLLETLRGALQRL